MPETKQAPRPTDDEPAGQTAAARGGRLAAWAGRLLTRKSLAILLAISLSVHVVGFAAYKLSARRSLGGGPTEIALGDFCFAAAEPRPGQVAEASFALHLALIDEVSRMAQQRLDSRVFRVQQGVEELLRRAHGTDFDDPVLAELKRQLQEQVNRTLELRAVADVIITDLQVRRLDQQPAAVTAAGAAEDFPWASAQPGGERNPQRLPPGEQDAAKAG